MTEDDLFRLGIGEEVPDWAIPLNAAKMLWDNFGVAWQPDDIREIFQALRFASLLNEHQENMGKQKENKPRTGVDGLELNG